MTSARGQDRDEATFETFLDQLAAAFVRVSGPEIDNEIEGWLRRIVEFFDADRSSLAQLTPDGLVVTHSWARPGYGLATGIRAHQLPWLVAQIERGALFAFTNPDDLPPEAVDERQVFQWLKLKAQITVPLMVSGSG